MYFQRIGISFAGHEHISVELSSDNIEHLEMFNKIACYLDQMICTYFLHVRTRNLM